MIENIKCLKPTILAALCVVVLISCERDDVNLQPATFSQDGDIFTDAPVGLTDEFFESFNPALGANPDGFDVVDDVAFEGTSSIRLDIPAADNPNGGFMGGVFRDRGDGRDLTQFNALSFYVRASTSAVVDQFGYGINFAGDQFSATISNVQVGTTWEKIIIPIPNPSKLVQERGLFVFSDAADPIVSTLPNGDIVTAPGNAYTLWIDELRFENIPTIGQPRPSILGGEDLSKDTFIGARELIRDFTYTANLPNGLDQVVTAAPSYFDFNVTNTNVTSDVTVNNLGVAETNVQRIGTSIINASVNGVQASGSLELNVTGEYLAAPVPPQREAQNVVSLFSDAYENVPVRHYNGFFLPFQTTQGGAGADPNNVDIRVDVGGGVFDNAINYTALNFVSIGTYETVPLIDVSGTTHLHVDINVQEAIDPGDFIRLSIESGTGGGSVTSGNFVLNSVALSDVDENGWASIDIPLGNFTGFSDPFNVGQLFFISDNTIANILVDNVYFYRDVIMPTPNVDDSAATEVALPVGFESTTLTYNFLGFEGADSAIEPNPDQSGINPTATVMRTTKTNGAQFFAGTFLDLESPIDFSTSTKFRMKVWSPKANIPIRVQMEDRSNPANNRALDISTTTLNEWEELEWDFNNLVPGANYDRITVFFEFITDLAGDGSTYYYDDLQILN